jgi:hypothetical protein
MEALRPPDPLEDDHGELVRLTRRPATIVEDAAINLANGEDPGVVAAYARRRLRETLAETSAVAGRLGVPACRPPEIRGL